MIEFEIRGGITALQILFPKVQANIAKEKRMTVPKNMYAICLSAIASRCCEGRQETAVARNRQACGYRIELNSLNNLSLGGMLSKYKNT